MGFAVELPLELPMEIPMKQPMGLAMEATQSRASEFDPFEFLTPQGEVSIKIQSIFARC